jgi:PAS domain-containing protein
VGRVVSDTITHPLLNETNETIAASGLINSLGRSFTQWYSTAKKLDSMLLAEREKFLWTAQNSSDPIIGLDLPLNITYINAAAEKVLGVDTTLARRKRF